MQHDNTTPSQFLPLTPLNVERWRIVLDTETVMDEPEEQPNEAVYSEYKDMRHVENHIMKIAAMRTEWAEIEAHAEAQIEDTKCWRDEETEPIKTEIVRLQASVSAWFKRPENNPGDKASRRLINGTLKRQKGSLSTTVIDDEMVPREWCNTTYTPDKTRAKKHFEETGELIEGLEFNVGETIWYVDTGHDNKMRGV